MCYDNYNNRIALKLNRPLRGLYSQWITGATLLSAIFAKEPVETACTVYKLFLRALCFPEFQDTKRFSFCKLTTKEV